MTERAHLSEMEQRFLQGYKEGLAGMTSFANGPFSDIYQDGFDQGSQMRLTPTFGLRLADVLQEGLAP